MVEETVQKTNRHNQTKNTGMAALAHLLGLMTWLGPILVYLFTDDPFVKQNAANATNWQISFAIWMTISAILTIAFIGFAGLFIFGILDFVFSVVATVKASNGKAWDYPLTIDIL